MKIALPVDEKTMKANVCQVFGRAPYILIYSTVTKECAFLDHTEVMNETASGIRSARAVADYGVKALLVPQCGENTEKILVNAEVLVYKSLPGTAQENIDAFLSDQLRLLVGFHAGFRSADEM